MNKTFMRIVSVVLCFTLVFCAGTFSSSAEGEAAPSGTDANTPFRISVSMNGDASSQRGFCWYTGEECESAVEICENGIPINAVQRDAVCEEWEGNFMHKVTVAGLSAGKTYTFRVGDGANWSEVGSFTTDDGDSSFSFITIADVQAGNPENFRKGARTLSAAYQTAPDAGFFAALGDFTNDSDNEQWDYYDDAFSQLNLNKTIVPVAGNHDGLGVKYWFNNMFNLDTSESVEVKDGVNYSFDYGNAHIAVVNTNDMFCMTLSQLRWLKNDMNSTDKDWKIIFMHKSPYTLGKDGKWPDALSLQRSLTAVCDMCDVDLVMSGHDHMYLRTKPLKGNRLNDEGTTYVLSGTAGSKRYEIRKFLAGHFLNKKFIAALNVQRDDYNNYWDGESWDNLKHTNVGGCYNTVTISGGTLTLNSYILSDSITEETYDGSAGDGAFFVDVVNEAGEQEKRLVTNTDTYTVTKETGKNKATFSGDNTTSEAAYALGLVPSFFCLAVYTFGEWLPKFLSLVPELLYSVIVEDTF